VKTRDVGQIVLPGRLMMLKTVGKCKGPNGEYELLVEPDGQPVVRSMLTMRKFVLTWQNIVELAVQNGIDDKGEQV